MEKHSSMTGWQELFSHTNLVFHECKSCHITPLLRALHWLPVAYRIVFKILFLTFKAIHKLALTYISELVSPKDTGGRYYLCLLYTSPSPRDGLLSRMPSSA